MAEEFETTAPGVAAAQPAWWVAMQSDLRAGMANVFILHGNVQDYVEHPRVHRPLREYLEQRLSGSHTVATYAPDQGITFPGNELLAREARKRFDQVLGADGAPADPNDPAALIRAASGDASFGGASEEDLTKLAPSQAIPLLLDFVRDANGDDAGCPQGVTGRGEDRRLFPKRAAVILDRMDLICPPEDKARLAPGDRALLAMLHRAGTAAAINERRNVVILLAPSLEEVHPDLRLASSGIRTIEVLTPDYAQRMAFIPGTLRKAHEEQDRNGDAVLVVDRHVELDGLTEVELANETAGLNRRHIEDIAMRAEAAGGKLTRAMVRDRKSELIKAEYAEVLEVLEPDVTFEMVGGHERVKDYLKRRVLKLMRDPAKRHRCPMGLLFAGPSGTGKTFLARALAHESGFNCVSMAPDNIRGSYVGESEKKLRKAIAGVEALAPCVLFVDEIDQKVRRTSGGGGGGDSVEGNIFGKLLEFFSDQSHRGQILLVAATNRPDNIDAALKRPGRIDAKIPLLPPDSPEERAEALAAVAARHEVAGVAAAQWLALGEGTDRFTQAELEGLVVTAAAIADTDDLPIDEALAEALDEFVPSTDDIELHTRLAIAVCSNRKLVPDRYRERVGKQLPKRPVAPSAGRVGPARDDPLSDDFELE